MSDEELARLTAYILGSSCSAAKAVRELDRRRKQGELAEIATARGLWIVFKPDSASTTQAPDSGDGDDYEPP